MYHHHSCTMRQCGTCFHIAAVGNARAIARCTSLGQNRFYGATTLATELYKEFSFEVWRQKQQDRLLFHRKVYPRILKYPHKKKLTREEQLHPWINRRVKLRKRKRPEVRERGFWWIKIPVITRGVATHRGRMSQKPGALRTSDRRQWRRRVRSDP